MTVADLFAAAVPLPTLEPPLSVPPGTRCALTGAAITEGYRAMDLVTVATAEFLDAFRGGIGGWVGVNGARCFRSANPRGGNPLARSWLVFEDGVGWAPMIARSAATATRPAWTDLVRQVWPARAGQRMAMILTTDTKKRLWPRARVGALGAQTPCLLYDASKAVPVVTHRPVTLDWSALLDGLDLVEMIYAAGATKPAIQTSLLGSAVATLGLATVLRHERALTPWRGRAEFTVAVLIAQKPDEPGGSAPGEETDDDDAAA